jgi:colanic acid biosynthesis glycosyl transferase WcaI
MSQRTLLIISQTYRPDPTAVGQYLADAAEEMARRGWRVVVLAANRGYDDPSQKYLRREIIDGVEIVRFALSSFGKRSIAVRMVAGVSFVLQGVLRALLMRRIDVVLISTSPPLAPLAGIALKALRRTPLVYWLMDLNPDQYVALGRATPDALIVRLFDGMNRAILRAADRVIVLDRFMAKRVVAKLDVTAKLRVIPPWSRNDHLAPVEHDVNPFRDRHGLTGKFVVMYSGNHGPSNPVATLLEAARRLRDDDRFAFVFIGGGIGKADVDAACAECRNILSLPYQPMQTLSDSLSAADVHAVTMGDEVVGIVHPSKVYGAFAVQRPVLFVGPRESHIGDMLASEPVGWQVLHGDADAVVAILLELLVSPTSAADAGRLAKAASDQQFGTARLCGEFCDIMEMSGA